MAAIVAPGDQLNAPARRQIITAVERAGIRIHNYDALRAWTRKGNHASLTGTAWLGIIEERKWALAGTLAQKRQAYFYTQRDS